MSATKPWLPASALDPVHFERAVQQLISEWSSHWFAKASASVRPRLREVGGMAPRFPNWRSLSGLCGLAFDEAGQLALAEAMLDRQVAANAVQGADRPLFEDVTLRALDDLVERIAALVGRPTAARIAGDAIDLGGAMMWEISLRRSGTSLLMAIDRSEMIAWRKRLAPTSIRGKLFGITSALAPQPVEIDAAFGKGSITLSELEQLAPGDVVLLDAAGGFAALRAAGRPTGLSGTIAADGPKATINLKERRKMTR